MKFDILRYINCFIWMYLNSSSDGRVETKVVSLKTWIHAFHNSKLEVDWETGEKVGLQLMGILDLLGDCNSLKYLWASQTCMVCFSIGLNIFGMSVTLSHIRLSLQNGSHFMVSRATPIGVSNHNVHK